MTEPGGNTAGPTIDDVFARIVPAEREVRVCIDGRIGLELEQLTAEWEAAIMADHDSNDWPTAPALYDQLEALKVRARGAEVPFLMRAMPSPAWRRLIADHPPADDEVELWRYHPETFPPAALAASCVAPAMTEEQAAELAERLSDGQWTKLWGTVLAVNIGDDLLPKSVVGTGVMPSTAPRSTTAPPEESPSASS